MGLLALSTVLLAAPPAAAATNCNPTPGSVTGAFTSKLFKTGGGEPAISVSPTGRVIIADGLGGQPTGQPANLYRSTDYGKTFQTIKSSFPNTGDVYVLYGIEDPQTFGAAEPAGVANQVYVAHLENGQMISHPVYIGAPGDSFISGFNWMTVDQAGTLFVLANGRINGHHSARLSVSKDKGKTWSSLVDLGAPGAANVYGAIAGGAAGALSLVYIRGSNKDPSTAQNWFVEMASVTGADTPAPTVVRSRPITQPMHTADICFDGILCGLPGFGKDRSLLDYIWNAVGPDGSAWAVVASNGPASRDASASGRPDILILHQVSGRSLGRGVQS